MKDYWWDSYLLWKWKRNSDAYRKERCAKGKAHAQSIYVEDIAREYNWKLGEAFRIVKIRRERLVLNTWYFKVTPTK